MNGYNIYAGLENTEVRMNRVFDKEARFFEF